MPGSVLIVMSIGGHVKRRGSERLEVHREMWTKQGLPTSLASFVLSSFIVHQAVAAGPPPHFTTVALVGCSDAVLAVRHTPCPYSV